MKNWQFGFGQVYLHFSLISFELQTGQ